MTSQILPTAAILVSLAAIVISLSNRPKDPTDDPSLEAIESRLSALELREPGRAKLSSVIIKKNDADISSSPTSTNPAHQQHDELESKLENLGVLEFFKEKKQAIESSYTLALDANADSNDRVEALGILRKAKRIDDQVASAMAQLWRESLDAPKGGWTRWSLMENFEGIQNAELRDNILEWIPDEQSAKMRSRAIETLGSMLPDPAIDEWLVYLGESDPDPEIREQAARTREVVIKKD